MDKRFIFLYLIGVSFLNAYGQTATLKQRASSTISDSIDITHITIQLDVTDYAGKTIRGFAEINFSALVDNISELPLDLLALTVDSIETVDGTNISFTQAGENVLIDLPLILNESDDYAIKIFYGGEPETDLTWGGWYWNGDYAYQLGVGFDAIPHNYGRVWFPCFDNFVERSTYRFEIITTADKKAVCGGLLESETENGDGTITWIWNINQTIPSYLASVAVSDYEIVSLNYAGIERDIPIQLAVKAEDSTDMKNSFVHLNDAMSAFENSYGAYEWDRIGYAVVPFSGGAMEHAMNIAYPLFAVNGTTAYESLMAHELSHHWWGDLITCSSAEEMWLNEGWAVYSEHLFAEHLYGSDVYRQTVRANHLNVLHYAHAFDGNNYFTLSAMPLEYTYGNTTYLKGADVVHTLRGYLGEELFFDCITSFLETFKFQAVSAADLRDHLTDCSGIDMHSFFDGWIYAPGFPAFEIEDIGYTDFGTTYGVCIEQKLNHAPNYFNNVPLTLTVLDDNWKIIHEQTIMAGGERTEVILPPGIPFSQNIVLDYHEKINDAVTADEIIIKEAGDYDLDNALIDITVNSISDSALLYAQHYWVEADNFKTIVPGLHVNSQRYWKITGFFPDHFEAEAKIIFNAKLTTGGGYLDNEFITNDDDSLVLLYRAGHNAEWEIFPFYELNTYGSVTDGYGAMNIDTLLLGEYTIGMYDHSSPNLPADEIIICANEESVEDDAQSLIKIYPNPAQDLFYIRSDIADLFDTINIYNVNGQLIKSVPVKNESLYTISVKDLPAGTYQIKCTTVDNTVVAAEKLVIIR
ncbi:MAG: T9SS type A sorting domain-containing protein [Chitinophagales bacterium]|nr:T9SS type A sorting domain-containing protein [Chitinophagales bacterium]